MKTKLLSAISGVILCATSSSHTAHNQAHPAPAAQQAVNVVAGMAALVIAANPIGGALPHLLPVNGQQAHPPIYPQAKHCDAFYRKSALMANSRVSKGTYQQNRQQSNKRSSNRQPNQLQQRRTAPKGR